MIANRSGGDPLEQKVSLASTSVVCKNIELGQEWEIEAAVTDGNTVVSDIASQDFVSGASKPLFKSNFYWVEDFHGQ